MNKEDLGKLYPVTLKSYDNTWPILFEKEKSILRNIFDQTLQVEHIGSTAVPGMTAKPTIDILIEKPVNIPDKQIIQIMTDHGYIHMTQQSQHLMFVKGYLPTGLAEESYHIHMGPLEQSWLWDRVYFRDYLKKIPEEARGYEKLKKELAQKFRNDRELYTEGKADYIKTITEKAKKSFIL